MSEDVPAASTRCDVTLAELETVPGSALALLAVNIGKTRLIDNLPLEAL